MGSALRRSLRLPPVLIWLAFGLLLAACCQALVLQPRLQQRCRRGLTRFWMRSMLLLLPVRVNVQGNINRQPALWLSNHVSWLDILVLGAHAPVQFLSKREVRDWPVIGWLANVAGTLFLNRGAGAAAELRSALGERLARGQSMVIFAEGTTTAGDMVLPFHSRLLDTDQTQLQIQPVALAYKQNGQADQLAPFIGDDEFAAHLWRLLGSPRIDVQLQVLPVLAMDAGSNRKRLAAEAQQQVATALGVPARGSRRQQRMAEAAAITGEPPAACATDLAWH